MSDFEQPVEPMSRAEAILRKYGGITPMSRVEALLKELVDESGGSSVTVTPVLSEGVRLATIGVDGTDYNIYAPEDVVGSIVSVTTEYNTGTLLATITVNDVEHYIYVPEEEKEILTGFATPSATLGTDGQIYVQYTGDQETEAETIWSGSEHWSYYQPQWKKIGDFNPLDYYRIGIYGSSNGFTVNNSNLVSAILELSEQGSYWNASNRFGIKIEDNSLYAIQTYRSGSSTLYSVNGTNLIADGVEQAYSKTNGTWFPFPSGGGSGYKETTLWENASGLSFNSNSQQTITLSDNMNNYDMLCLIYRDSTYVTDRSISMYPVSEIDTTGSIGFWVTPLMPENNLTSPRSYYVSDNQIRLAGISTKVTMVAYKIIGIKFGGGSGGSSEVNYSTEEQRIGTWIDGKPLYQITKKIVNDELWADGTYYGLSVTKLDFATVKEATFVDPSNSFYASLPYHIPSTNNYIEVGMKVIDSVKRLTIRTNTTFSATTGRYIVATIIYTKTTD